MKRWFKIFLLIGILLIGGCTRLEEENEVAENLQIPDQESFNTFITLTKEGKKMAEVWAAHVQTFSSQKKTLLKDSIHVDFFDRDGEHKSVLTAKEGIIFTASNDMTALGNVVVISDSGLILKTERLHWKNNLQRVVSDTTVVFVTHKDTLYGDYFESDPDLKEYIIKNTRGVSHRKVQVQ